MDLKGITLNAFRLQWASALREKFADDPEKLRQADMSALAKDMFGHAAVKASLGAFGVTEEDIAGVLCEVRDEILKEEQ